MTNYHRPSNTTIVRRAIGIAFLLLQFALVIHARFVPSRWLSWAPNDYVVQYELRVSKDGHDLTPSEIQKRYQLLNQGWYENPAENIMDIVRQYERTYGRNDAVQVRLSYRQDGSEKKQWQWPEK